MIVTKEQLEEIKKILKARSDGNVGANNSEHSKETNRDIGTENNRNEHNNMGKQDHNPNRSEAKRIEVEELEIEPAKTETEEELEEYQCAGCEKVFRFPKGKYPDECPECGMKWR